MQSCCSSRVLDIKTGLTIPRPLPVPSAISFDRTDREVVRLLSDRIVGHSSQGAVQVFGSIPMRSLTADEIRWAQPR